MQSQSEKAPRSGLSRDPRLEAQRQPLEPSVLAGIAAGLAGATFIVVALLWWAVSKKFLWPPLLFCVAGAGAIAAYVVTNRERLVSFWKQRTSREFVNSTAFAFFVLGIVVLVNIIGARHHWRHDFTESKRYSLSEQTMKILRGLDKPVRITAFISPDYYDSEEIRSRLREYDIASPKTEVTIYDPKTNITRLGSLTCVMTAPRL